MKKLKPFRELFYCFLKKIRIPIGIALILMIQGNLNASANEPYSLNALKELSKLQQVTVTGTITDASTGEGLIGVNITIEGTNIGRISDANGKFSIEVPGPNSVLVISYIGYKTEKVVYTGQTRIDVQLSPDLLSIGEVVVTALGIQKDAKSIGYSTATVDNEQIAISRETNIGNALVGKVAGMNVTAPTTGPGGSSKIRIRGQSSFGGYNSPLIIVNGVPFNNSATGAWEGGNPHAGSSDIGDGLQSLNPDDIASMTVLKGTAASALYGYRAKDGVIIITTKSGRGQKGIGVEINSNFQTGIAIDYTDYQYEYGQGENGIRPANFADARATGTWSFGEKFDGVDTPQFDNTMKPYVANRDRVKDFFRPANAFTNTVAINGGNMNGSFRLSFSNTSAESIVPNSDLNKKILNLGVDYNLTKKLKATVNVNYSNEYNRNPPQVGTERFAIPTVLQTMSNSIDVDWLAKSYILPDGNEWGISRFTGRTNPYWSAYKAFENVKKDRLFGNVLLRYDFTDWLYAQAAVGQDYFTRPGDWCRPTGSLNLGAAPSGFNGNYYQEVATFRELNMDFLIGAKKNIGDFGADLTFGGNTMDQVSDREYASADNFYVRDLYTIANGQVKSPGYSYGHKKVNSLYGSLELSYKSLLFVTLTGRNDWFSTLNPESNSYLYPSVSTSFVFSDLWSGRPSWFSFGKIRVAHAEVGGDTDPYSNSLYYGMNSNQLNGIGMGGISSSTSPNPNLRPLKVKETEVGLDLRTFDGRLNLDVSYYIKNTIDEILNVTISKASGYNQTKVNIGKLRNKGVEMILTVVPVRGELTWESNFSGAYNESKVLELAGGQTRFQVGFGTWYGFIAHELDMPLASIQANDFKRNTDGTVQTSNGKPIVGNLKTFGSGMPKVTGAWTNTWTYKGFKIFTQIDFKANYKLLSNTAFNGLRHGLIKESLPGRENGIIMDGNNADGTPNTKVVPAEEWYSSVRNLAGPFVIADAGDPTKKYTFSFVYKGDYVKWRTISIGYDLKRVIKTNLVQGLDVNLFINNVLMIKKYLPNYDPEAQFAISDNFQGIETHCFPTTRNYGINLNVKF